MSRLDVISKHINGRILDVGHSVGPLHDEIAKRAQHVVGIDIEIKKYRQNTVKGDAQNMPLQSKSFDTVLAGELIEHLYKPEDFVAECKRILKKGGKLILTTPNRKSLINRVFRAYHKPAHIILFTKQELMQLLDKNGFEIEEYTVFPYTEESSEGSRHKWFFAVRKMMHPLLPSGLQEEMVLVAKL